MSSPFNRRGGNCYDCGSPVREPGYHNALDEFEVLELCRSCTQDAGERVGMVRAVTHYTEVRSLQDENEKLKKRAQKAELRLGIESRERRKAEAKTDTLLEALDSRLNGN